MTKKQRTRVVELLRCAADRQYGIRSTGIHIGMNEAVEDVAMGAWWAVQSREDYVHSCLEAAARVEEGSYP